MKIAEFFLGIGLILMLFITPLLFLSTLHDRRKGQKLEKNCTCRVMATLVDVKERIYPKDKGPDSILFLPTYAYEINGVRRTVQDKIGHANTNIYTVGTQVEMLVDPEDASHFKIEGLTEKRWRDGTEATRIVLGIGAILTLIGALLSIL